MCFDPGPSVSDSLSELNVVKFETDVYDLMWTTFKRFTENQHSCSVEKIYLKKLDIAKVQSKLRVVLITRTGENALNSTLAASLSRSAFFVHFENKHFEIRIFKIINF